MKTLLIILTLNTLAFAQLPTPWTGQDIGNVGATGSSSESGGTYTIRASGADIWNTADEFHYVHQQYSGDVMITARVVSLENTDNWAKAGLMIRESLADDSKMVNMLISSNNGRRFQYRSSDSGDVENPVSNNNGAAPEWIRLVREGSVFTGYYSDDGINWQEVYSASVSINSTYQIGLSVTSHNDGVINTSVFDNVTVEDYTAPEPVVLKEQNGYFPLFNGQDFTNWYHYQNDHGYSDPEGVFKVENGLIHLLDLDENESTQPFGWFATNDDFKNYRLRFEYMWGTKKYAPRGGNVLRDSGFLYHMIGDDIVWPTCAEAQVQEGDTGDFFMLGGTYMDSTVSGNSRVYSVGGNPYINVTRTTTSNIYDQLTGWNEVEIIVTEDEGIHIVNGLVNNRGTNFTHNGLPLTEGKIAFQSEGAEIFYRNIELKPHFTTGGGPDYKVLVFSKTAGYRHDSISAGQLAISEIGLDNGFTITNTEDSSIFNDLSLAQYSCVIFLNTTGDILNASEEAAFEQYVANGGGYVGIHSASDTEYGWDFYGDFLGAYFDGHPAIQEGVLCVCHNDHPSTNAFGKEWTRTEEWYNFSPNPADNSNIDILMTVDESTYNGGNMGETHPISWCQEYEGGRSWYTAMGHASSTFSDPAFRMHLLGGIEWAAGKSHFPTSEHTILYNGRNSDASTDTSKWISYPSGGNQSWDVLDDNSLVVDGSEDIATRDNFEDFRLHLEFRPNSTSLLTNESNKGSSGVYLQGRYEIQILDSFNRLLQGEDDCASIYGIKNADTNASLAADAWQHYDIWFKAARWVNNTKVENAKLTLYWNGCLVHDSVELTGATPLAPLLESASSGPIILENENNAVRFRNIWIEEGASFPDYYIKVCDIKYDNTTQAVELSWESDLDTPFQIYAGSSDDLKSLSNPLNTLLPVNVSNSASSPYIFPLPPALSTETEVFFQIHK